MAHLDAAIIEMNKLGTAYQTSIAKFNERDAAFQAKYAAAAAAQEALKQLFNEHTRLTTELRQAEADELDIRGDEDAQKANVVRFNSARTELAQLVAERERVLNLAAHRVEELSGGLLKAKYKSDPRPAEYVDVLIGLTTAARVHDVNDKAEEWVKALVAANANPTWDNLKRDLLALYQAKIAAGMPLDPTEEQVTKIRALLFPGTNLTSTQVQKLFQNIDDDRLAAIFAAVPRDYIIMTYIDQGRDVPFEQASPGQQASALLELLLQQSAGTLIIDQPEDDLDNRIIMQIVALIRGSKSNRQLLFTTHNPNIVVNGDADKVIALKSGETAGTARIQVEVDGAIETPAIRKAITHLMEGGKAAFDLRNRKYNFDTIPE